MQEQPDTDHEDVGYTDPETRTPHILLAEDDDDFRALLSFVLRNDGYRVTDVAGGMALLDALLRSFDKGNEPVSLVISDERMPGIRGLEVLMHAREYGLTAPLVLITAFGDDELIASAAEAGVVVIRKPFEIADLRIVARFLTTPNGRPPGVRVCLACGRPACARWVGDSVLVLCLQCRELRGFRFS